MTVRRSCGCSRRLLEADPTRYIDGPAEVLDTVIRLPAGDAATRLVQAEAERRLAALKSSPED